VRRHGVYPDDAQLPLRCRDHGLDQPQLLAWRLSNTMEANPCTDTLEEALARFGPPSIMNTDSQKIAASSWAV
jgi:hypothetical protein